MGKAGDSPPPPPQEGQEHECWKLPVVSDRRLLHCRDTETQREQERERLKRTREHPKPHPQSFSPSTAQTSPRQSHAYTPESLALHRKAGMLLAWPSPAFPLLAGPSNQTPTCATRAGTRQMAEGAGMRRHFPALALMGGLTSPQRVPCLPPPEAQKIQAEERKQRAPQHCLYNQQKQQ